MNKTLHVAIREFMATVATKGFVIGMVIMPLMMLVMILGMKYLFTEEAPRIEGDVAVIDPTGEVTDRLREYLQPDAIAERRDDFQDLIDANTPTTARQLSETAAASEGRRLALDAIRGEVPKFDVVELPSSTDIEQAKGPLLDGKITDGGRLALVVVHEDAVVKAADEEPFGKYDLFLREKLDVRLVKEIKRGMRDSIADARVTTAGLDRDYIDSLTRVGSVPSKTVTAEGEKDTNELLNILLPVAFIGLLFASVMTGGQSLMTSTVEEKSSRVVEVLLSAVSPMQMMTGKIIGQMFVGFLVLAVYSGMGIAALISFALADIIELSQLLYLFVFYLIAYFVVASLLAAIGAAVNEMREAQSLMGPVMIILMIPWILCMPIAMNPNSTFAVVTSFLPPINSFVMLIRLTSSSPPPDWQAGLSIAIGVASIYVAIWFAAKVFRVGLLMYGKPPNFATLIKWVRAA